MHVDYIFAYISINITCVCYPPHATFIKPFIIIKQKKTDNLSSFFHLMTGKFRPPHAPEWGATLFKIARKLISLLVLSKLNVSPSVFPAT